MANFARLKNIKKSIVDFFSLKPKASDEQSMVDDVKEELDEMSKDEVIEADVSIETQEEVQGITEEENVTTEEENVTAEEENVTAEDTEEVVTDADVDPVMQELQGLKITSIYPTKVIKSEIKERDRKYFEELYTTDKAIKHTDIRGNQAAVAVASATGAVYLGVVAASAVALPAVVMALIGFGVGGGAIYAVNKLTGKESAFGSLYRKLKTKFGVVKPKIKVKNYKKEHDALKNASNSIIAEETQKYTTNLAKQKEVETRFNDHIRALSNDEASTYAFEDDAESQSILDEVTSNYNDALSLNYELHTAKNRLESEIANNDKFITELNSSKEDIENKSNEAINDFAEELDNLVADTKDFKESVDKFIDLKAQYDIDNDKLDVEQSAKVAELLEAIEKLENLPNKEAPEYVAAIAKAKAELAELNVSYNDARADLQNKLNSEIDALKNSSIVFDELYNEVQDVDDKNDYSINILAEEYLTRKLKDNAINGFEASIKDYTDGFEDGVIITSEYDPSISEINAIVTGSFGNANIDVEPAVKSLIESYNDRVEEIEERLIASFDMNLENAEQTKEDLSANLAEKEEQINNLEVITKNYVEHSREKLKARRESITNDSAAEAIRKAKELNEQFEQFKIEQSNRFHEELTTTTPEIER